MFLVHIYNVFMKNNRRQDFHVTPQGQNRVGPREEALECRSLKKVPATDLLDSRKQLIAERRNSRCFGKNRG